MDQGNITARARRPAAVDSRRGFLFVLDTAHAGRVSRSIAAGAGVDNIDYALESGMLYAAGAAAAQLTVARIDDSGKPIPLTLVATTKGAHSVVAGPSGCAYLIDPTDRRILKIEPK